MKPLRVSVMFPEELLVRVERASSERLMTKSAFIRAACQFGLENLTPVPPKEYPLFKR